jgi:Zn-dependent alcohol dehydrogenase
MFVMGADRVVAIKSNLQQTGLARQAGATDILDEENEDVLAWIKEISRNAGA